MQVGGCDNAELRDFRALCEDLPPPRGFGGGWVLLPPLSPDTKLSPEMQASVDAGKVNDLAKVCEAHGVSKKVQPDAS
jgi:hypothetical protein